MELPRKLPWPAVAAGLMLGMCAPAMAGVLARATLLAPLAPERSSRLAIAMPAAFAADQEVWVAYELIALSSSKDDDGEIGIEQSFEGVMTPAMAMFVTLEAGKLDSHESAGTITRQLEQAAGPRRPGELRELMGAELYAAYGAVNAGQGRIFSGRLLRKLPGPGKSDAPLLVSVERAEGIQPLMLKVTVGQGALPGEFQQQTADSPAYKAGYAAGVALFGWLVMRFFRRRRD